MPDQVYQYRISDGLIYIMLFHQLCRVLMLKYQNLGIIPLLDPCQDKTQFNLCTEMSWKPNKCKETY